MILALYGIGTTELIIVMGCCSVPMMGALVTAVVFFVVRGSQRPKE